MRLEETRHLAAAERGALVVVPGAGHDVNTDAPDAFNRILGRALRDFARASAGAVPREVALLPAR
jgi:pimeloyl-ACP methyl ester carboxylesterase